MHEYPMVYRIYFVQKVGITSSLLITQTRYWQFWESQANTVRHLVGPVIYHRIAKIFNLKLEEKPYEPQEDLVSLEPSEQYYKTRAVSQV